MIIFRQEAPCVYIINLQDLSMAIQRICCWQVHLGQTQGNKKGEKFKNFSPFLLFAFEVYLTGFNQHN